MKWCNFFNKISLILQALGCAVLYFVIEAMQALVHRGVDLHDHKAACLCL